MSPVLRKTGKDAPRVPPNMDSYAGWRRSFTWESAWRELGVEPGGPLNITEVAMDRNARGAAADSLALRVLDRDLHATELTFRQLAALVNQFVNALAGLGIKRGAVVASFMGRLPELYITALGAMKSGCSYCPLFSAFGPEPAKARLELGGVQVLVTTDALYRRKIAPIRALLPQLRHVLIVRGSQDSEPPADTTDFHSLCDAQSGHAQAAPTHSEDAGTAALHQRHDRHAKGAVHVHEAVVAHHMTRQLALDLHPDDIFWCTADPGWVTGTSYGIIVPLTNGVTSHRR